MLLTAFDGVLMAATTFPVNILDAIEGSQLCGHWVMEFHSKP